jgi:glucose/arabinose dehydrogenase
MIATALAYLTSKIGDQCASDYRVFAEGGLKEEQVSGRPVDLLLLADGSMLVSDDLSGSIYRISYKEPLE